MGQWSRGPNEPPFIDADRPQGRLRHREGVAGVGGAVSRSMTIASDDLSPVRRRIDLRIAYRALPVRERMKMETVAFKGNP